MNRVNWKRKRNKKRKKKQQNGNSRATSRALEFTCGGEKEGGNHVPPRFSTRVPETTPTTRTAIRNKPINMLRIPVTVCLRGRREGEGGRLNVMQFIVR